MVVGGGVVVVGGGVVVVGGGVVVVGGGVVVVGGGVVVVGGGVVVVGGGVVVVGGGSVVTGVVVAAFVTGGGAGAGDFRGGTSLGRQRLSRSRRPITGGEAAGAVLIVRLSAESLLAFAATDFHRRVSARTSAGGTIASSCVCVAFTPRR